jgi:hypothetical protein
VSPLRNRLRGDKDRIRGGGRRSIILLAQHCEGTAVL